MPLVVVRLPLDADGARPDQLHAPGAVVVTPDSLMAGGLTERVDAPA